MFNKFSFLSHSRSFNLVLHSLSLPSQVPNSAIRECTNFSDVTGKDFMDPSKDETCKGEKDEDK